MKAQNVLTKTLLCVALTAAPIFSSFAESEGGLSGGGGSTIKSYTFTASTEDVKKAIDNAKFLLQFRVLDMQANYSEFPELYRNGMTVSQKMILSGAQAFIAKMRTVKIINQMEPCSHPSQPNQKLEGAAYPERNTICISAGQIDKRQHPANEIWKKVSALLAHEMFHILNPSNTPEVHELATQFQNEVEQGFAVNTNEFFYQYADSRSQAYNTLNRVRDSYTQNQAQLDLPSVCSDAVQMASDEDLTFSKIEGNGLRVQNFKMKTLSEALNLKFWNLASVCYLNKFMFLYDGNKKLSINLGAMFPPGVETLTLLEFNKGYQREIGRAFKATQRDINQMIADSKMTLSRFNIGRMTVRRLTRERTDHIAAELTDILNLMNQYRVEVNKLPNSVGY